MMKIFILSLSIYIIYLFMKTSKSLQMLQQNRYNRGNKYLKWVKENKKKNFLTLEAFIIFIIPLFTFVTTDYVPFLFNAIYFFLALIFIYKRVKEQKKVPLKYTGRVIRLFFTTIVLYLIIIVFMSVFFYEESRILDYWLLTILAYFNNMIVVIANLINVPIETCINHYFKNKATKKLQAMSNLEVVGITGSYGKTSSKNILNDVLNVKYNCIPSPKNYNTPFGLMITINDYLDKFNDYFIAEMGACKVNEIKELCDLVHPKYGILTKIGLAHLETFGSQENIQKTKFELIESLPKDGVGILNADDPLQVDYKLKNDCSLLWIGIENQKKADIYATNIKLSSTGTTFDCYFKNQKEKVEFSTKLLGKANIYNILAAIALGSFLGLSKEQLVLGVKKVRPVEHRLELKKYYNMHLIDDAYNANPEGAKMALDVLNLMEGKKIVITSGMIELGSKSYELNKDLGCYMHDKIDTAILIGKEQTRPIYDGLVAKKFKKQNILQYNDIMDAFAYLQKINNKDTYILLQSDLPDIFNES